MGAGILPVAFHNNKLYLLFSRTVPFSALNAPRQIRHPLPLLHLEQIRRYQTLE